MLSALISADLTFSTCMIRSSEISSSVTLTCCGKLDNTDLLGPVLVNSLQNKGDSAILRWAMTLKFRGAALEAIE